MRSLGTFLTSAATVYIYSSLSMKKSACWNTWGLIPGLEIQVTLHHATTHDTGHNEVLMGAISHTLDMSSPKTPFFFGA